MKFKWYFFFTIVGILGMGAASRKSCLSNTRLPSSRQEGADIGSRILQTLEYGLDHHLFDLDLLIQFHRHTTKENSQPLIENAAFDALYAGSSSLLASAHKKALDILYAKIDDNTDLKSKISQLIENKKLASQQARSSIQATVQKSTPLQFSTLKSSVFKLYDDGLGSQLLADPYAMSPHQKFTPPLKLIGKLIVSKHPISVGIWNEVMGGVPAGFESRDPNSPILNIEHPAIYLFLNRLSEKYNLKPAYDPNYLFNSIAVSVGSDSQKARTYNELIYHAARNQIRWDDNVSLADSPMVATEGFRLPGVLEVAMIFEKIRSFYRRVMGRNWDGSWNPELRTYSFFDPRHPIILNGDRQISMKEPIKVAPRAFIEDFLTFCPLLTQEDDRGLKILSGSLNELPNSKGRAVPIHGLRPISEILYDDPMRWNMAGLNENWNESYFRSKNRTHLSLRSYGLLNINTMFSGDLGFIAVRTIQ